MLKLCCLLLVLFLASCSAADVTALYGVLKRRLPAVYVDKFSFTLDNTAMSNYYEISNNATSAGNKLTVCFTLISSMIISISHTQVQSTFKLIH